MGDRCVQKILSNEVDDAIIRIWLLVLNVKCQRA